ncbi:MAG: tetratricopeptide repeat protein [Leptospiraceae bacterium]|nr:tetratricopeptide repeat protein [Leptospiraceae bacterium]
MIRKQIQFMLLVTFFSITRLFGVDFEKPTNDCSALMRKGKLEFVLSKAYLEQIRALKPGTSQDEKLSSLKKSIQNFDLYESCAIELGREKEITELSYLLQGVNFFEIGDLKRSIENLDKSLKINSKNKEAILLKSRAYMLEKKYEEASVFLEKSIPFMQDDSTSLYLLGTLNAELGNYPKAILYYGSLWSYIQKGTGDVRYRVPVLKNMTELLARRGETKRAIYYLKNYLKYRENDTEMNYYLATLYSQSGNLTKSKEVLFELQKKNQDSNSIQFLLAEIYFIENRTEAFRYLSYLDSLGKLKLNPYLQKLYYLLQGRALEVREFFEAASAKNETRMTLYIALAEIYKRVGSNENYHKALLKASELAWNYKLYSLNLEILAELIEKFPKDKTKYYEAVARNYLALNSPNKSRLKLQNAIQNTTDEKERLKLKLEDLGILRANLKGYKECITELEAILAKDKNNVDALFALAICYFQLENYKLSLNTFTKLIAIDPKNSTGYYYRSSVYMKLNEFDPMVQDLKKLIELNSDNPIGYNALGFAYAEKGIELEESLKLIQKAIELEPDSPAYRDSLGWIYFKQGKNEEALHNLMLAKQVMEEKGEEDSEIYEHLGDVYLKMKDKISARENLERALKIAKDSKETNRIEEKIKSIDKKEN